MIKVFDFKFVFILLAGLSSFVQAQNRPFETEWRTTRDNEVVTIPTNNRFRYDYTVDWGDGRIERHVRGNVSHRYRQRGNHRIEITGRFPAIFFNDEGDKDKIKSIRKWGDIQWESMSHAFEGCANLNENIAAGVPDLSSVSFMNAMFLGAERYNADISDWDVSNVVDMTGMFEGCESFNHNIRGWDVGKVISMERMFSGAVKFNQPLGDWDVRKVETMRLMFNNAVSFDQDIGFWKLIRIEIMESMFRAVPMSVENYSALLSGWSARTRGRNIDFGAPFSYFCGERATRGRARLMNDWGWKFEDAGERCKREEFVLRFRVDRDHRRITIPVYPDLDYDYTVYWGDGSPPERARGQVSHDYIGLVRPRYVSVAITGDFPGIYFNGKAESRLLLSSVYRWGDDRHFARLDNAFHGCENLIRVPVKQPAPGGGENLSMSGMFRDCSNLRAGNFTKWQVGHISDFTNMFRGCVRFDANLETWRFVSAADMRGFLVRTLMSKKNYDKLLISMSRQPLQQGVTLKVDAQFCQGARARQTLIDRFGWAIFDFGQSCARSAGAQSSVATAGTVSQVQASEGVVVGRLSGIRLYPNPVVDYLTIDFDQSTPSGAKVILFDKVGRRQMATQKHASDQTIRLDASNLTPGIYTLSILYQDGNREVKKVMISR